MQDENELFLYSIRAYGAGGAVFSENKHADALPFFAAALEACKHTSMVDGVYRFGVQLVEHDKKPILAAEYFLLAAKHAKTPEQKIEAVSEIVKILNAEITIKENEFMRAESIFKIARRLLALAPSGIEGLQEKVRAMHYANTSFADLSADANDAGRDAIAVKPLVDGLITAALDKTPSVAETLGGMGDRYFQERRPLKEAEATGKRAIPYTH